VAVTDEVLQRLAITPRTATTPPSCEQWEWRVALSDVKTAEAR
jgi:hypothetical protein